jgi:hypothetical protein
MSGIGEDVPVNRNGKRKPGRLPGQGANQHTGYVSTVHDAPNPDNLPPALKDITDNWEAIARTIEHGVSVKTACQLHNVPVASWYWWKDHGTERQVEARTERHVWLQRLIAHRSIHDMESIKDTLSRPWDWPAMGCPDSKWGQVWAKALDSAYKCSLELAKRLLPDVYGDRLETRNLTVNVSYAVDFGATRATGKAGPVIDVIPEPRDIKSLEKQGNKRVDKA